MPKIVDHDERRRQISAAVLRVVAADGVAAATLRRVAADSGFPMSTIQHYFAGAQEMLQFALARQEEAKAERIALRVRAEWENGPRAVLEGIMAEVLPITKAQRQEAAVGVAYYVAWHRDEELKASLVKDIPAARAGLAVVVAEAQRRGEVGADADAEREAELLLALFDSLASGVVVGYHTPQGALETAQYYLDRLFAG